MSLRKDRLGLFIRELVEEMTELKREKYHRDKAQENDNSKLKEIEDILKELGIGFKTDWTPLDDLTAEDCGEYD